MDIIAPQTKELWEKSCCIEQSWYRTAEEMKRHASSLEEENAKLRELFPKILDALGNGSGCTPEVSLEFLQGIPKEVELVVKNLKYAESFLIDTSKSKEAFERAEDERIDIAKELKSEKKMRIEMQYKLEEMQKAMFQHVVGLLSTYGEFAFIHPEEVLLHVKKQFKCSQQ